MPRPGPRRPTFTLRLSEQGLAELDRRALAAGLTIRDGQPNRSEMARRMLERGIYCTDHHEGPSDN